MEIQESKEKGWLREPQTSTSTKLSPVLLGIGSLLGVQRKTQQPLCFGTPLCTACTLGGTHRSCWDANTAGYGYRQRTAWIRNLHLG